MKLDHVVTSGTFSLDGGTWEVDNNVWVLGDDAECLLIDAPHQAGPIADLIGNRILVAILCTHAHDDHVSATRELSDQFAAPVYLHPDDDVLWQMTHPGEEYFALTEGQTLPVAGTDLQVLHTPGHSPGSVCFYDRSLGAVFTGDTLFEGGPGATGRSYSDYGTIVESIRTKLFTLPPETLVHTGHGPDTTISTEIAGAGGWRDPGT